MSDFLSSSYSEFLSTPSIPMNQITQMYQNTNPNALEQQRLATGSPLMGSQNSYPNIDFSHAGVNLQGNFQVRVRRQGRGRVRGAKRRSAANSTAIRFARR